MENIVHKDFTGNYNITISETISEDVYDKNKHILMKGVDKYHSHLWIHDNKVMKNHIYNNNGKNSYYLDLVKKGKYVILNDLFNLEVQDINYYLKKLFPDIKNKYSNNIKYFWISQEFLYFCGDRNLYNLPTINLSELISEYNSKYNSNNDNNSNIEFTKDELMIIKTDILHICDKITLNQKDYVARINILNKVFHNLFSKLND